MRVRVLFFGMLRDIVGRAADEITMADSARLEDVFEHYASVQPRLREMRASIVLAHNQEFSGAGAVVRDGDEVAFLPPVSGGLGAYSHEIVDEHTGNFFALTRQPISVRAVVDRLLRPDDGAFVDFEGVVRNNSNGRATQFLDYECYEAMAVKVMAKIGGEIASAYAIGRIGMVHRLGRLHIGETSVVVVVTAPHRRPAFEAALEGINRLKKTVPIWKKEHFADGEVWVEGDWDESVRTP